MILMLREKFILRVPKNDRVREVGSAGQNNVEEEMEEILKSKTVTRGYKENDAPA